MTRRTLVTGALAVLFGIFVGLGATAGKLYWNRIEERGEQTARTELVSLAATEIPKVLGYEYKTVEGSLTETFPLFTGDYRREFEARAFNDIIPQARERQLVNQVDVTGVGIQEVKRTTGSVLVFINRTMTSGKSKEPLHEGSRLRVEYRKVERKWLISNIAPI